LEAKAMSAKKSATKKKTFSSKKRLVKRASTSRPGKSKSKSFSKAGSAAKRASNKKLAPKVAAPKALPKPSGKKTVLATPPKRPGLGPIPPLRPVQRPLPPPTLSKRRGANLLSGPVKGFTPYQPKRGEEYMNKAQLLHFRELLLAWKRELMEEVDRTMLHMKDDAANFPDPNDRATQESEFGLELRTRDRERKLLKKIDSALGRIEDGSYGFCEETGDQIGLRRLEARPVATLCVEAQERRELAERQFRDREDQYR